MNSEDIDTIGATFLEWFRGAVRGTEDLCTADQLHVISRVAYELALLCEGFRFADQDPIQIRELEQAATLLEIAGDRIKDTSDLTPDDDDDAPALPPPPPPPPGRAIVAITAIPADGADIPNARHPTIPAEDLDGGTGDEP